DGKCQKAQDRPSILKWAIAPAGVFIASGEGSSLQGLQTFSSLPRSIVACAAASFYVVGNGWTGPFGRFSFGRFRVSPRRTRPGFGGRSRGDHREFRPPKSAFPTRKECFAWPVVANPG